MNKLHVKRATQSSFCPAKTTASRVRFFEVSPKEQKVIVEGCNMVTKHAEAPQSWRKRRYRESGGRAVRKQRVMFAPSAANLQDFAHKNPCRRNERASLQKCGETF